MDENKRNLLQKIKTAVLKSWSKESCYPGSWDESNPCKGQCEPTACVVQDYLDGDIYKLVGDVSVGCKGAHFYNLIDGEWIDLTVNQFPSTPAYAKGKKMDGLAFKQFRTHGRYNRKQRYNFLKSKVQELLNL